MNRMFVRFAAAAAFSLMSTLAVAQTINMGGTGSTQPIEITARDGIEWDRDAQRYVANGDAAARQGDTTVYADKLIAWYRQAETGGTEIFRYEAQGNVRIATQTQTVFGDRGVYDIDSQTMVVTGKQLRLVTPTDTLTARDTLEYHGAREVAVARGNAMIVSGTRRMTADVMTAYFGAANPAPRPQAQQRNQRNQRGAQPAAQPASNSPDNQRLKRVESFGNVHVSTPTEIARGDRGVYNMETSIAQLAGNVRLTRGDNQLAGDFAEVNNNTGISRLLSRPAEGSGDGRVRGLFVPQQQTQQPPAAPAPANRPGATRP